MSKMGAEAIRVMNERADANWGNQYSPSQKTGGFVPASTTGINEAGMVGVWPGTLPPYTPTVTVTPAPIFKPKISLTMAEVDILRAAARYDVGLKGILQKFIPFIEVIVTL